MSECESVSESERVNEGQWEWESASKSVSWVRVSEWAIGDLSQWEVHCLVPLQLWEDESDSLLKHYFLKQYFCWVHIGLTTLWLACRWFSSVVGRNGDNWGGNIPNVELNPCSRTTENKQTWSKYSWSQYGFQGLSQTNRSKFGFESHTINSYIFMYVFIYPCHLNLQKNKVCLCV